MKLGQKKLTANICTRILMSLFSLVSILSQTKLKFNLLSFVQENKGLNFFSISNFEEFFGIIEIKDFICFDFNFCDIEIIDLALNTLRI